MSSKYILVTGGCGYIGSHIVKLLSASGEKVVVYDNLSTGRKAALLHNEALVIGDITDKYSLPVVFQKYQIDTVIHCAALVNAAESVKIPELYDKVNRLGSEIVWEVAKNAKVKYCIYASSAAVYGNPGTTDPIDEKLSVAPTNPYGQSKLSGENSLIDRFTHYLIFRFFNVAGSDSSGKLFQSPKSRAIITRLMQAAKENEEVILSGHDYPTADGTVIRDFIHVNDIAEAVYAGLKYLRAGGKSEIMNLGSEHTVSMLETYQLVTEITGRKIPLKFAPRVEGDIISSLSSSAKAKKLLNWSAKRNIVEIIRDAWKVYETK